MTMKRLEWKPGVNVELTESANPQGWSLSNCIRWRWGKPESLLGFLSYYATKLAGVCRALHYYTDLAGTSWLAAGTNSNLYVAIADGRNPADITPTFDFTPGPISDGSLPPFNLLIWSLDNFGQILIASPSAQGIFSWTPPNTLIKATIINEAPAMNNGCMVLDQIQMIMAWGCTPLGGGNGDAMLVRWCDQSDFDDWTASTTNQAGSYRLPHGSRIIAGLQIPGMALLWTDIGVWSVQYLGFPLVFSFQSLGQNCGVIAQKAVAVLGQVVYWMSADGFFRLSGGGPEQIPCPIWDVVFLDLDTANQDKCVTGTDFRYSEVWFLYPSKSGGSGEIDSYAKINIQEGEWDFGPASANGTPNPFARTAWTDQNQPGLPINASFDHVAVDSTVLTADSGYTQGSGGAPIPSSIRSGYADIGDGGEIMAVDQLIPDFKWFGDNPLLTVSLYFRTFPEDDPTVMGPFTITPTTEYVTLRTERTLTIDGQTFTAYPAVRGREVAIEIAGVAGGWRLGNCRLRGAPSGRI